MASREEQKRHAREDREARARDDTRRERRDRRLRMLGIAAAGAVVLVVAAIMISTSGSGERTGGEQTGPVSGAAEVRQLFDGVPQDGFELGDPAAPVTLTEFADLRCPHCRDFALASLPTLVTDYVKAGKLRIVFRNWAILGPDSETAARAAEGAAEQDRAWQFIDLWYQSQGDESTDYVTDDFIRRIASAVPGLDADRVLAAAHGEGGDSIAAADSEARKFGLTGTPAFLIQRAGDEPRVLDVDWTDPTQFTQAIDPLVAQQ